MEYNTRLKKNLKINIYITGDQRPVVQAGHGLIAHESFVAGMVFKPQYSEAKTRPFSIRHHTERSIFPSPQVTEH